MKTTVTRRRFLEGASLSLAGLALAPVTAELAAKAPAPAQPAGAARPQVAIFGDRAIFDHSGRLETYVPPRSLASSTRAYVDSVDRDTFLSRHWFA